MATSTTLATVSISPAPFVGREVDLAAARDLLARPGVRMPTVTGPGGIAPR